MIEAKNAKKTKWLHFGLARHTLITKDEKWNILPCLTGNVRIQCSSLLERLDLHHEIDKIESTNKASAFKR